MKHFINFLLLFFLASNPISAQPDATPATKKYAPAAEENSLLWKISGKGLTAASYLYGTIHLIDAEKFFLSDSARAGIDKAGMVTFEINMEDMMDMSAQMGLLLKAFMEDGQTLGDLLSEEDYNLVKEHFDKIGMPLFMLERIKPMFLTVLASGDMSPDALNSGEMVSYEMEIMKLAEEGKKKMGGLETMEFQMSVFDSIPYKAQAEMLVQSIKSTNAGDEEFAKMMELYLNQDINGMVEMMGDEEGMGNYEDLLLVTRNKKWIPVMGEMMKQHPTFFAVGAGHLGGETGVVALLRKEGYILEPVK